MISRATQDLEESRFADASHGECWSSPDRDEISRRLWDAVVIGAGPAGAASAFLLARRGWRVLLLERSAWPREKPCGGCLSASATACLRQLDLLHVISDATRITNSQIHRGAQFVSLSVDDSVAIDRAVFDSRLVAAFVAAGGTFAPGASAVLSPCDPQEQYRELRVRSERETFRVRGRIVLACDGIAGSSVQDEPWATWRIARDAYFGISTSVSSDEIRLDPGVVHMHIGNGGYVGAVRYDNGGVHLAAALDVKTCRASGGPAVLIESILHGCGNEISLRGRRMQGTPTLTRMRPQLGGHRVLAVGDACGYIEPFTGEGIAWALRCALEVVPHLGCGWSPQTPLRWRETRHAALRSSQNLCRVVRFAAHRPLLASVAMRMAGRVPAFANWVTRVGEVAT